MNAKQAIAASILALTGTAALADDPTIVERVASTQSRDEVRAGVLQACEAGTLPVGGEILMTRAQQMRTPSLASRDEVRSQARAATLVRTYEGS